MSAPSLQSQVIPSDACSPTETTIPNLIGSQSAGSFVALGYPPPPGTLAPTPHIPSGSIPSASASATPDKCSLQLAPDTSLVALYLSSDSSQEATTKSSPHAKNGVEKLSKKGDAVLIDSEEGTPVSKPRKRRTPKTQNLVPKGDALDGPEDGPVQEDTKVKPAALLVS
ncbi:hypothetical protein KSP40_PGU003160 [Platanthera guangdongensis]|uniref:Uncharacterized protein n=1 Tax=Platanthera guangdongensis TaxID=2320717 RepID=A0ABR2MVE5_9ASPA